MAKTTPSAVGPWPGPIPFGDARAAVWLDRTTASAAVASWLTQAGVDWVALEGNCATMETPVDWATAGQAAIDQGARWLVVPVTEDDGDIPLPLRLHAAETALRTYGLDGLWAPLLGWNAVEIGRLALALGVDFAETVDCLLGTRCGDCDGCRDRVRMFKQLGMADPAREEVSCDHHDRGPR
jgi:hypothetical protein